MSQPVTTEQIGIAAIRYVKASIVRAKHEQSTKWASLKDDAFLRAYQTANELTDEVVSARTELYGLVGQYEGRQ